MNEKVNHDLKIAPNYFQDIITGKKTFELRKNDRGYKAGDWLMLSPWHPATGYYGNVIIIPITYILENVPGLEPDYVILALSSVYDHTTRKELIENGIIQEDK